MLSVLFIANAQKDSRGGVLSESLNHIPALIRKLEQYQGRQLDLPGVICSGRSDVAQKTASAMADQFYLNGMKDVGQVIADVSLSAHTGTTFSQFMLPQIEDTSRTVIAVTAKDVIESNVQHLLECNQGIALSLVKNMPPVSAFFLTSNRQRWAETGLRSFSGFQFV